MVPFRWPAPILAPDNDGAGTPGSAPEAILDGGFSLDYVRALRRENKDWQFKAAELETAANKAREELGAARAHAERRVIQAEVGALAARAGMVDPDGTRLLDLSGVRLTDAGVVEGADAAIAAARKARPWLFADARSSNPAPTPRPRDAREGSDARQMTPKEYAAARKDRAWRR